MLIITKYGNPRRACAEGQFSSVIEFELAAFPWLVSFFPSCAFNLFPFVYLHFELLLMIILVGWAGICVLLISVISSSDGTSLNTSMKVTVCTY